MNLAEPVTFCLKEGGTISRRILFLFYFSFGGCEGREEGCLAYEESSFDDDVAALRCVLGLAMKRSLLVKSRFSCFSRLQ